MKIGFRYYYDKDLDYIKNEYIYLGFHDHSALMHARKDLRMYANLFCRDMRKVLLNEFSTCAKCQSTNDLEIDHIIPISKGGKNIESNTQILCSNCNNAKSNK